MKKVIFGITAAIMLAGASVYAANKINNNKENAECKSECCCPLCDDCCGSSCCSK